MSKKPTTDNDAGDNQPLEQHAAKRSIALIAMPDIPCTYDEWHQIINANFPDLVFASKLCMAVTCQLLINDVANPFGVVLVDVPSAGKTITLNFFDGIDGITYTTDKFTPASFVSNASNRKKEELKDIDLLPRIKDKVFIVRDMATLFSKREDDLNELLGLMTRVFDGEGLKTDTGVFGARHYSGDYNFMFMAASTPPTNRIYKMMSTLGSRLFFVNLRSRDKSEDELAEQLGSSTYKHKQSECHDATERRLQTLWATYPGGIDWDMSQDKHEHKVIIGRCARLLARLRGAVKTEHEKDEDGEQIYQTAQIEKPDRLNQLFYNLARGNAVSEGRNQISEDDLKPVVELTMDSALPSRSKLIRGLVDNGGTVTTSEAERILGCSKTTARKEMETFETLGIGHQTDAKDGTVGEPEKILTLHDNFRWFLSNDCMHIRGLIPKQLEIIDKPNPTPYKDPPSA